MAAFLFFKGLNVTKIKLSKKTPYAFGVWLLNDHPYVRVFLEQKIFHSQDFYSDPMVSITL